MALGQFRSTVWDPLLIISQIIAVQAVFYSTFGIWTICLNFIGSRPTAVHQMFDSTVGFVFCSFLYKKIKVTFESCFADVMFGLGHEFFIKRGSSSTVKFFAELNYKVKLIINMIYNYEIINIYLD